MMLLSLPQLVEVTKMDELDMFEAIMQAMNMPIIMFDSIAEVVDLIL